MGVPSRPLDLTPVSTGGQVGPVGPGTLRGWSISSTAGATVTLYDNTSAAGLVLGAAFTLAAGGSSNVDISDGARFEKGIFMVATAAVTGNIRVG